MIESIKKQLNDNKFFNYFHFLIHSIQFTWSVKFKMPRPQNVQETILNTKFVCRTNENKVNPVDWQKQVLKTAQWPSSVHGVVAMKFYYVMSWGSGGLIRPNVVVTGGYNLENYDDRRDADLESMQFLPAINDQNPPFGTVVEVENYFVSSYFLKEEKEDYDILILQKTNWRKDRLFWPCFLRSIWLRK